MSEIRFQGGLGQRYKTLRFSGLKNLEKFGYKFSYFFFQWLTFFQPGSFRAHWFTLYSQICKDIELEYFNVGLFCLVRDFP